MPTYAYRCVECGHEFEDLQSIAAEALVKCPNCGKNSLKRGLGGGTGMIFKGQGFYQTDYKKSGEKNSAPATNEKTSKNSPPKDKPEKESGKKTPDKSEKRPDKSEGKEK